MTETFKQIHDRVAADLAKMKEIADGMLPNIGIDVDCVIEALEDIDFCEERVQDEAFMDGKYCRGCSHLMSEDDSVPEGNGDYYVLSHECDLEYRSIEVGGITVINQDYGNMYACPAVREFCGPDPKLKTAYLIG